MEEKPFDKAVHLLVPFIRESSDLTYDQAREVVAALLSVLTANGLAIVRTEDAVRFAANVDDPTGKGAPWG